MRVVKICNELIGSDRPIHGRAVDSRASFEQRDYLRYIPLVWQFFRPPALIQTAKDESETL